MRREFNYTNKRLDPHAYLAGSRLAGAESTHRHGVGVREPDCVVTLTGGHALLLLSVDWLSSRPRERHPKAVARGIGRRAVVDNAMHSESRPNG